mmetsp:Transcript_15838/g.42605  ORF Transcript_15838/g.42605 Transcript_15838/m.42605 type:complete len:336 (-) Transcript_15838:99-1106(-)
MLLQLGKALGAAAHALLRRHGEETADEVGGGLGEGPGEGLEVLAALEALDASCHVLIAHANEREISGHHLAEEEPKRPPVHALAVVLLQEHLGRGEGHGADHGVHAPPLALFPGVLVLGVELLGKPEVGKLEVAVVCDEDVLGLEVAVHEVVVVDVLDGEGNLGDVDLRPRLGEGLALEVGVEVAAAHELEDKVDVVGVLEGEVESHHEGVFDLLHGSRLGDGSPCVTGASHVLLDQHLQGVQLARGLLAHEEHGAKAALADLGEHVKVVDGEAALFRVVAAHLLGHPGNDDGLIPVWNRGPTRQGSGRFPHVTAARQIAHGGQHDVPRPARVLC